MKILAEISLLMSLFIVAFISGIAFAKLSERYDPPRSHLNLDVIIRNNAKGIDI